MFDSTAEAIRKLEESLFLREFISDASYLGAVLSDDFEECGKSGRLYSKADTVANLLSCEDDRDIKITDFSCCEVGDGVFLAHYATDRGDGACYRTSIWRRADNGVGFELVFHQATELARV
jgi:hypothetical protein